MKNEATLGQRRESETRTTDQVETNSRPLSPRERRLLEVLLELDECGRHDLDHLAGYENSPDGVMGLRRKHGFEIPMQRRPFIDRDGKKVRVGYYSLTVEDTAKARSILGGL